MTRNVDMDDLIQLRWIGAGRKCQLQYRWRAISIDNCGGVIRLVADWKVVEVASDNDTQCG